MAIPVRKVELGFDKDAPGLFFVLDNATSGVLDNSSYVLGGATYYDVTEFVKSVSISRGKNRELERFNAGSVSIQFNNQNRYFDPTNTESPFFGQIVPRREVRVTAGTVVQFYGLVDDYNLDYSINNLSNASLTGFDGISLLAGQTLAAGTATAELSGARIEKILDSSGVNWPVNRRNIDAGGQFLQADVVAEGTNVMQYINLIEQSEPGNFFVDKLGDAVWQDRNSIVASVASVLLSDDGTGIPYADIRVNYGSELMFNQAELSRLNGGVAFADDLTSQTNYGVRTYSASDLLMNTDTALGELAVWLVSQYANPEYRFESVTIPLADLDESQQATILGLDIGSICRIKFRPNGIGSVIDKFTQIIGISHQMSLTDHRVVFSFQTIDNIALVLDDSATGLLDFNSLGF
jgi:hypothetical protein